MGLIPQQLCNLTITLTKFYVAGIIKFPKSQKHTPLHKINYGLVEIMDDLTFFIIGLNDALGTPLISWQVFSHLTMILFN